MTRDSRRCLRSLLVGAILPFLAASWLHGAQPAPKVQSQEALSLLHQGRFREAAARFRVVSDIYPADPEGPLYEALTTWWRLLDAPDDSGLQRHLEERLEEATRRGETLIATRDSQRGLILAGTAHLLAAQARAASGSLLAAGRAARKGHRHLEEALERDPNVADAWFALGAYKYFAARLPWIVRALRFLVLVPGGDAEEGLAGLESAAARGDFFRCEALLLLTYIFDGEHENDGRKALKYFGRAESMEPHSPLFELIRSRLEFSIGRLASAERSARNAITLTETLPGVAREVLDLARLRLALALYYQYRPEEAYAALQPLVGSVPPQLPTGTERRFWGLLARLRHDLGEAAVPLPGHAEIPGVLAREKEPVKPIPAAPLPTGKASEGARMLRSGNVEEAVIALREAVQADAEDLPARYHLARAYEAAGRREEEAAALGALLASEKRLPKTLRGWILLRLGDCEAAAGRSREALAHYRRAAAISGFPFRKAAQDRIKYPADPHPLEG